MATIAPNVVGLIFAKRVEVDVESTEFSLRGLFHHCAFEDFPVGPAEMVVFALLTGGRGEGILELAVHSLQEMEDYNVGGDWVYRQQKWIKFLDDPRHTITLEMRLTKLKFQKPRDYLVVLKFDGNPFAERRLSVSKG
jgi:hypothetical protein